MESRLEIIESDYVNGLDGRPMIAWMLAKVIK